MHLRSGTHLQEPVEFVRAQHVLAGAREVAWAVPDARGADRLASSPGECKYQLAMFLRLRHEGQGRSAGEGAGPVVEAGVGGGFGDDDGAQGVVHGVERHVGEVE
jgi:hypothetical protein